MAGRNPKPIDLELKGLKFALIDLVVNNLDVNTGYTAYMRMYEEELEALVGEPKEVQKKALRVVAQKVISSYQRDKNGGG